MNNRLGVLLPMLMVLGLAPACRCGTEAADQPLAGAHANTAFVSSQEVIYFLSRQGLEQVRLDGKQRRVVFSGKLAIADISGDGQSFALLDEQTRLWLGQLSTGKLRPVEAPGSRAGGAAFAPDGKTLALFRSADQELPHDKQPEDDTLYLVDTASLQARTVAPSGSRQPTTVAWTTDGKLVHLGLGPGKAQLIDAASGQRRPAPASGVALHRGRYRRGPPTSCARRKARLQLRGRDGDNGLDLVDPTSSTRLVALEGDKRGFHDHPPAVRRPFFSRDCRLVVFALQGQLWVVEPSSKKVGRLVRGHGAFPAPAAAATWR